MATTASGTTANNSLTYGLEFLPGYGSGMATADIATMANKILNDQINGRPIYPQAFSANGILYVPNRGILKMLPGDWVMVDPTCGWPILVSKDAVANGPWHT